MSRSEVAITSNRQPARANEIMNYPLAALCLPSTRELGAPKFAGATLIVGWGSLTVSIGGRYGGPMAAKRSAIRPASSAVEDYLEQILELINTKGYARVVDIADRLKISQASVTNMVQRMDAEGLLKYEKYRGLVLTTAGEELAKNITQRHQLLTDFLKLLGIDDQTIYHDVEGMEHHISPPTLRAIETLTAHLERQPALLARIQRESQERGAHEK